MKIDCTPEEYELLLDLLAPAQNVLLHATECEHHREDEDAPDVKDHFALLQNILSLAKDMEAEHAVGYDDERKLYGILPDYFADSPMDVGAKTFEEEIFWSQLITRLAERDMMSEAITDAEKQMEKFVELAQEYEAEFVEHGLERLDIQKTRIIELGK
jgi:hypothetical protein